ncbi:hypothetical protein [Natronococcus wangiae]|uniref:hypothetical protein n=1 Tax=Natronococcus wangiae TaxID=3068275 RepID=UPI0027402AAB|nr:hypothetical protein [Natronococcus sp. AD5]
MAAENRLSRRAVLRTIGAVGASTIVASTAVSARAEPPEGADRYLGVVDRIVDGRHVVLLLEEDNRVVDQLVLDVDEFDSIEERDVLVVVIKDGELYRYQYLPKKPESSGRNG